MDGHFVPNLTFGPQFVSAVNRSTALFLDVHLMMYNPFDYIERFVESGADLLTFHIEATEDVKECIEYIKRCSRKVGIALCPETSPEIVLPYLPMIDQLLIMTVNPGFGGQSFINEMVQKIQFIAEQIEKIDRLNECLIQVDGGITFETAKICLDAGASVLVSGNFLFSQPDMANAIEQFKNIYSSV
jgi:ribulose-phosphate 3-epimerase